MEIGELSKKHNINASVLRKIEKKYGSMDQFQSEYVNAFLNGTVDEMKLVPIVERKAIKYFDLSEPDAVGTKDGYAKLVTDLLGINLGFIAKESISKRIDAAMDTLLNDRQKEVLSYYYSLRGEHKTHKELAKKYGISKARIGQIKDVAMLKFGKSILIKELSDIIYSHKFCKKVLSEFFTDEDVFYTQGNEENSKIKSKLTYIILKTQISELNIVNNETYIDDSDDLEKRIKESGLDEKQVEELLIKLNERKKYIAMNQNVELFHLFERKVMARDFSGVEGLKLISLNLSTRIFNCLSKREIYTVGQLLDYSLNDLMIIKEFGENSLAELTEKLESIGIRVPKDRGIPIRKGDIFFVQTEDIDDETFCKNINEQMIRFYLDEDVRLFINTKMEKLLKNKKNKHKFELQELLNNEMVAMGIIPEDHISILKLGLSTRLCNILGNAGIESFNQLIGLTKKDIRMINKLGVKSFQEIIKKIEELGFEVPENDETIEVHNIERYIAHCKKADISNLAKTINEMDISEDDKAFLLGELLKKSIGNLQQAYQALNEQVERYEFDIIRRGEHNVKSHAKKSNEIIAMEKRITSLKRKKSEIEDQIGEIKER